MANGDQQVVPGQTTGTTPPILPAGGVPGVPQDPSAQLSDKVKSIMQMMAKAAQAKQAGGTPIPQNVPAQEKNGPSQLGMNTANPHAWGTQRFLDNLGS